MKQIIIIMIIAMSTGCQSGQQQETEALTFEDQIIDWQNRESSLQQHLPEMLEGMVGHEGEVWVKLKEIMEQAPEMTYMHEEKDYWMDSEEFALNGFVGDCDDMAIYSYYLIREAQVFADNDVAIRIVNVDDVSLHMVVVVYSTARPVFVDNGSVRQLRNLYHDDIITEFNLFAIW